MCGIAGYIDYQERLNDSLLRAMTDSLTHRGPDAAGYWTHQTESFQLGFGHRRLSILDLSENGAQPMHSDCGRYTIVHNGEVYNFSEVRSDLQKLGSLFNSDSDTEVILNAFREWGPACVDRFIGMFAFVVFDAVERRLFACRDRAGVKPFYYYFDQGLFLFASELKAFYQVPHFPKTLDLSAISSFFRYSYIPSPLSAFKHTYKLEAGHYLTLDIPKKSLETHCYWDVIDCYNQPKLAMSYEDAQQELEALFHSAFGYRMVSDVPVGMFLSGGYDSTAVTALLQAKSKTPLKTFTIGFEDKAFNEAEHAKAIAAHIGTDHTEYYCTEDDLLNLVDQVPFFCDEPFGDPSIIPTSLVSKVAREHVTVSLSADGADEIFAGYPKYYSKLHHLSKIARHPYLVGLPLLLGLKTLKAVPGLPKPSMLDYKIDIVSGFRQCHTSDKGPRLLIESNYISYDAQESLFLESFEKGVRCGFDDFGRLSSDNDVLNKMLAVDYKMYMNEDILTKVDRATMSVSLEGREPFLDHRIIEFAARLPGSYKYHQGVGKRILKDIVHRYVPESLLNRPKQGFAMPIHTWFKGRLKGHLEHYLGDAFIHKQSLFDTKGVQRILGDYHATPNVFNSWRVWYLLMFNMWWDRWIDD